MTERECDVAVIGGGAAGMAAAMEVAKAGLKALVLDREPCLGGILQQCIHTGFGLHRFKEELSGPEYAGRDIASMRSSGVEALLETTVLDMEDKGSQKVLRACSRLYGVMEVRTKAVILAMGCRERNRGNIGIPGTRPAGVMTAGLAQRLLNLEGCIPGKRAVIVGSGDIGLIMARRLAWTGSKVLAVVEILPYPSGLARNIAQCLDDYGIPLMLSHTVTKIIGRDRVEAVEVAPVAEDSASGASKTFTISCDAVLLSVGLIPENELSKKAGVPISLATGGPAVDSSLMTGVPGVFACGNVLHVHDLVDHVSEEAERCGREAAGYVSRNGRPLAGQAPAIAKANLKYVNPSQYLPGTAQRFSMRALAPFDDATLSVSRNGECVVSRKLRFVRPSEMIVVDIPADKLGAAGDTEAGILEFSLVPKTEGKT